MDDDDDGASARGSDSCERESDSLRTQNRGLPLGKLRDDSRKLGSLARVRFE